MLDAFRPSSPGYPMPAKTEQVNFRVSEQGKKILYALQDHYGISQSAVFEMLLRDRARELGIDPKSPLKLGQNRGR